MSGPWRVDEASGPPPHSASASSADRFDRRRVGRYGLQERHQLPETGANLLDQQISPGGARLVEPRTALFVLGNPAFGVLAAADVVEDLLHRAPRLVGDDLRSARV